MTSGPLDDFQAEFARVPLADPTRATLPDEIGDDQAILLSDIFPPGTSAQPSPRSSPANGAIGWEKERMMASEHLLELSQRLPLLITGITGVAGFNALHYFQKRYPGLVTGIRPQRTTGLRGPGIVALNAENVRELRALFDNYRFRSVLNCAGHCALKSCELDPRMARIVNVATAVAIGTNARDHGARLVHLSTDLVFSGDRPGGYTETDPVDPVSVYGRTMGEAEQLLAEIAPDAVVLRIALPMGAGFNRHAGAIDWIQSRFRKDRRATLYFDEVRSCTYVEDLSRVCEVFLAGQQSGLYHVGGPRPVSLYQIGQIVNRVGGFNPDLLHGCMRTAAGPMPPRAGNVSMCNDKLLLTLGKNPFRPWPASEAFLPTDSQWHRSRGAEDTGSVQHVREVLYRYPGYPPI
jgi:dTDP-4-dehydrorhamnose reductase